MGTQKSGGLIRGVDSISFSSLIPKGITGINYSSFHGLIEYGRKCNDQYGQSGNNENYRTNRHLVSKVR